MSRAWSARSLAGRRHHRIFYGLIRFCGVRAAYGLLLPVVLWYSLFSPARSRSRHYLGLRFPGSGRVALWLHQLRLNFSFGLCLVDRAAAGIRGQLRLEASPEDEGALRALATGGCILLTAHTGAWQLALPALAGILPGKAHVVMIREPGDVDLHVFEHSDRFGRIGVIDATQGPAAVMAITQALLRGESLGMMGDRLTHDREPGLDAPFLGRPARFPVAPYRQASACGVPVAVCFAQRTGPCRARLRLAGVIRPPANLGPRPGAYAPYVAEYARLMEEETATRPHDFFNFYNVWGYQG